MAALKYDEVNYYTMPGLLPDAEIKLRPIITKTRLQDIMTVVSKETGVKEDAIKGKTRVSNVTDARKVYSYLAKKYTTASLCEIGRSMNSDHTTIITQIKVLNNLMENDRELRELVRRCEVKVF
jgi:chromosomal replication initiation ATPase DnaA